MPPTPTSPTSPPNNNICKYICTCIIFIAGLIFLIQSVAVVIDFDETENYINNTCSGIGNFSVKRWNILNNRAITTTTSVDSGLNITLYYPPINTWIIWYNSDCYKWYNQLKSMVTTNKTFQCYINYPDTDGITHHLTKVWFYYMMGAIMFIVCSGCIIYCCVERTHIRNRDYYQLN